MPSDANPRVSRRDPSGTRQRPPARTDQGDDASSAHLHTAVSRGIEIVGQTLISARDVAEIVPPRRRGRRLHRSTFHRWCTRGQDGVVLESIWIGGQRFTTVEALRSFFARLTDARRTGSPGERGEPAPPHAARVDSPVARDAERHRRVEAALLRLHGI